MYTVVDHMTPRQAPSTVHCPMGPLGPLSHGSRWVLWKRAFTDPSDLQEQPGNMRGQYISESSDCLGEKEALKGE